MRSSARTGTSSPASPSGTGPFKLGKLVPRELAELAKNPDYWDKKRLPKADKIVLIPMPEALTRTNALLAGQVDLIETPAPDAVPQLKSAGMRIVDNVTPHVWNYHLSVLPGSPWTDIRLRKALNLAIDRDAVVALMNGLAKPAKGQVDPSSPWFGKPAFELKYDVAAAKKLVQEAGYSKEKPLKTTFVIAQGGTGQMLSLPMNEFLQQSFKEIGIEIDFKVVELETLYTAWRKGAADEMNANITSNNIAYVTSDPLYAIVRFFHSGQIAPVGVNWGGYKNPKVDALIDEAKQNFDVAKQDELLAQAHAQIVDDAVLVWVVHDTNPHALSPKVKKFVQAQHWFQDLTHDRAGVERGVRECRDASTGSLGREATAPAHSSSGYEARGRQYDHAFRINVAPRRTGSRSRGCDGWARAHSHPRYATSSATRTRRSSLPAAEFPGSWRSGPRTRWYRNSSAWTSSVLRPRSIAASAPSQSRLR